MSQPHTLPKKKKKKRIWPWPSYRKRMNWLRARVPERVKRWLDYYELYVTDHGFLRSIYANTHQISKRMWRTSQPSPSKIRRLAEEEGIRTIVNLRGPADSGFYRLERETCETLGIELVDLRTSARRPPSYDWLYEAKLAFDRIAYPAALHCKSGADRAGLISVYYLHVHEGVPIGKAREQLSGRYGHMKTASTGILDAFWDLYEAETDADPAQFFDWLKNDYDPEALQRNFHADRWSSFLVDKVLRREG